MAAWSFPPLQHNVKGDGSCFYRALYQSARAGGVLRVVVGAFLASTSSTWCDEIMQGHHSQGDDAETGFVVYVKACLAIMIRTNLVFQNIMKSSFDLMSACINNAEEVPHKSMQTIDALGNSLGMPDWFKLYFTSSPHTAHDFGAFLTSCQVNFSKPGMFAGGLDTAFVTLLLAEVGILVEISKTDCFPMVPIGQTLYLRQIDDDHYNWMEYIALGATSENYEEVQSLQDSVELLTGMSESLFLSGGGTKATVQKPKPNVSNTTTNITGKRRMLKTSVPPSRSNAQVKIRTNVKH